MAAHGADGGTGSARRRRERRLRSWLMHEQQSIAAVLATVTHHSFDKVGTASGVLRNRKTATRTGKGEEYETHYTAKFRKTPPPQAAATEHYPMTDDEGGLSAGVRPAPLEETRSQGKLERHAGIGYEIVQNFDVPVPQMVEQLPNIVQFFAALSPVPEQVIAVPKILPHEVLPATYVSRHAAGGTPGGSADDSLLPQAADSRADRRQSSSAWWSSRLSPWT